MFPSVASIYAVLAAGRCTPAMLHREESSRRHFNGIEAPTWLESMLHASIHQEKDAWRRAAGKDNPVANHFSKKRPPPVFSFFLRAGRPRESREPFSSGSKRRW